MEYCLHQRKKLQASQHFVNGHVKQYIVDSRWSETMSDNDQVVLNCAFVQPKEAAQGTLCFLYETHK